MKILMVDDNAGVRKTLRTLLSACVDQFVECTDGSEALDAYREHGPDWVLMDVSMKNVDGISATRDILAQYPDARIIIVTDYGDSFFRSEADNAGAYAFVRKDRLKQIEHILRGTH